MRTLTTYLTTIALAATLSASAQPGTWDKEKYPDLPDPHPTVNMQAARKMIKRMQQSIAAGNVRPDHLNNALNPSFPPIINQSGGSCGAASSIYYQFTNQINTARFVAADSDERRYATHFPWLFNTNGPNGTGYDRLGRDVGIASCAVYGGTTYSRIYGNSGQDDSDDDCGWMQGYDSWFATMHNRILSGNSFPFNCGTEEGRELVKNYLWNRCGDDSYASGGICGIGVAAGPFEGNIPKTDANQAAGVVGMKYVTDWNETYNHAMTIVGYDDRIEFDLDGNGIIGEQRNADGDNEVGAWIICNSWGDGYANNGFIYCPYEKSNCVKGWPKENSFTPGFYDVMRDYRPLRTIRVKMQYSRRSEIALHVGVAQNLSATTPEKEIALTHFEFAGDGNRGKTQPAPEIPMLGRWADGELHTEPMEFGYDLTDLTQDFDLMRPLKYFFWVETRAWGVGEGMIHEVSIIDYTLDHDGVEVPFALTEPVHVPSAGQKTELTAVVAGDAVPAPRNLTLDGTALCWHAPTGSRYEPTNYRIYHNGEPSATLPATTLQATIQPGGSYTVSAIYQVNGHEVESKQSAPVAFFTPTTSEQPINLVAQLKRGSKLVIPELISQATPNFTLEFWVWPRATSTADNYGFRIKADTTTFFFKIISGNKIEVGNDGGSYTRSTATITPGTFHHIAIVNEGLNTRVYDNGRRIVNWKNAYSHYGLKGPARLVFGETEGTTANYKKVYDAPWNAYLDEIRFWTCARTEEQIKADRTKEIAQPLLIPQLAHYYKMGTRIQGQERCLIDSKGVSDATIMTTEEDQFLVEERDYEDRVNPLTLETTADFACDTVAVYGQPFPITDLSAINTAQRQWTFTGTQQTTLSGTLNPVVLFTETGLQTIHLVTTTPWGEKAEKTATVRVSKPEAPSVDFRLPQGEIGAGQHVTFINTSTPIEGTTFEWDLQGADHQQVNTVNAAATFPAAGTYEISLVATNSQGTASITKTVEVKKMKPQAAFSIQHNMALVGEKIFLLDESRYDPEQWTWDISSGVEIYRVPGQFNSITLDTPGTYAVSLTAENEMGQSTLSRMKAITVCNADGGNGLKFDGVDDLVVSPSPFPAEGCKEFSIDWWMFPGRLTDDGCHIGDQASTLQFSVKPTGQLIMEIGGKTLKSAEDMVRFEEWHHYAVTYKAGAIYFYRDGQKISNTRTGVTTLPELQQFTIGGTEQPMNAIVDELRIWNYVIADKDVLAIGNQPVNDPQTNEALLLYYDFNQGSGDVIDRSAHHHDGRRVNFGPDGDAWESTLGIFSINPKGEINDVTSKYLKNYKHPFKRGSGTVNPANSSRYVKLLYNKLTSPWIQKNDIVNGNILTQWHVDTQKDDFLTLETTWSGFAEEVHDLMIYQTVELPAGSYEFYADREDGPDYNWEPKGTYVVAGNGDELPTTERLADEALAYDNIENHITFMLSEPTTVSLGLLSNMSGQTCCAVGSFKLYQRMLILQEANGENPSAVSELAMKAEPGLQAMGGLGAINIRVQKPQRVCVSDLSGKVIFRDWLDTHARIPAHRGIYVVNNQKVMVK